LYVCCSRNIKFWLTSFVPGRQRCSVAQVGWLPGHTTVAISSTSLTRHQAKVTVVRQGRQDRTAAEARWLPCRTTVAIGSTSLTRHTRVAAGLAQGWMTEGAGSRA
jgi:hypothetical protein